MTVASDPRSSVFDLARKLLRVGDAALLDAPLEQVAQQVPEGIARDSLVDVVRAGLADTLRTALEHDRLDRFAAERCTQREEEGLCRALSGLLGRRPGGVGDDDPARLVRVTAPPRDAPGLIRWAAEHGVLELLDGPADAGLLSARELPMDTSWAALWLSLQDAPAFARGRSLLASDDGESEITAALVHAAQLHGALAARARLWQAAIPAGARALCERLRALLSDCDLADLARVVFVPARPVAIDVRTGVVTGHVLGPAAEPQSVRLFLSGYEQRGLTGRCSGCPGADCLHRRALAGRLLDALLDPGDRLHEALMSWLDKPSWQRFVDALKAHPGEPHAGHDRGQLSFQLQLDGHMQSARIAVSVFLHKPLRGGGHSSGRRVPIARAARGSAVADEDRPVLDALSIGSRPLSTTSVPADPLILRALTGHPRVRLQGPGGEREVRAIRVSEVTATVLFSEQGDGLLPRVQLAGQDLPPEPAGSEQSHLSRFDGASDTLFFAPLSPPVRRVLSALSFYRGVLPPESFDALAACVPELEHVARVEAPKALAGHAHPPASRLLLRLSEGPGEALEVSLCARPLPLGALWPPGHGPALVHGLVDGKHVHARRDLDFEQLTAKAVLHSLALHEHTRLDRFVYRVEGTQAMLLLLSAAARLSEQLELEWSERVRRLTLAPSIRPGNLNVRLFKKGHWLELEGGATSGAEKVAIGRLLDAARRGERFVRIEGNTFAEIESALFSQLERAHLMAMADLARVRIASAATPAFVRALGPSWAAGDGATAAWLQHAPVADVSGPGDAPVVPESLPLPAWAERLRGYQREGVGWLFSLSRWAPGACLADEMGLGKTVQAIALLDLRAPLGPALVVAPTSVTDNWCSELVRFAPGLEVRVYRGPRRAAMLSRLSPGDVLVTSYDVLLRDAALLSEHAFATAVVDEAQWIKNARTARARAVRAVQVDFRLALTGTPLENRLGDLWSLCALIAPGLLGSWARFRSLFAVPIERYGNDGRAAHLRAIVAPFFLRRTKAEVAAELPSRTEVVYRVELSAPERQLYETATREAQQALRARREDRTRLTHVLSDITRLRQLACHPRLVLKRTDVESSKLAALLSLLDDLLPRGHRALLFSQFVEHLSLVREALDARGVEYLYLDGSTPSVARAGLVERFQGGEGQLFLISLKAGGTGLNLTGADYVVHLDPWWNPAAEDQASDRAHRIGQSRPVTIVKLVAADTIEERVLSLHEHKRELSEQLFSDRATPAPLDLSALEGLVSLD